MKSLQNAPSPAIVAFWDWFSSKQTELVSENLDAGLVGELEDRLFQIEELDWEIGPGTHKANMFAVSPAGDQKTLQLCRQVIAYAPCLPDWEFYPAKPPRKWQLRFTLATESGEILVNGADWEVVCSPVGDRWDLTFRPSHVLQLEVASLSWAATILTDGELGEEMRMEKVENIRVVEQWPPNLSCKAQQLSLGLLRTLLCVGDSTG